MTTKRPTTDLTSWPEGALRGCARHAERPDVRARAIAELERRAQRPWLSGAEKIIAIVNLLAVLGLISIAFWLSGCSFPAEGTGAVACEDCYRPPHFPGAHIEPSPPADTEADASSSGGDTDAPAESSEGDESSGTPEDGTSSDGSSEGSESSTGEPPFEEAHCDASCPEGDALEPSEAQAGGTLRGCYCASPCDSDDDCGALEHCEPLFGRCTIACASDADCMGFASPPGSMACTLWWDDVDHNTHLCTYWNEDAP